MKSIPAQTFGHSNQTENISAEEKYIAIAPDLPVTHSLTSWSLARDIVPALGLTVLFSLWFCGGLLYVLPNNGGSGLSLPFNTLSWIVMAFAVAWLALTMPDCHLRFSSLLRDDKISMKRFWLIIAGAILWTLPLYWASTHAARMEALPHVLALWGLLAFIWMLRRVSREACQYQWLTVLWVAALFQALFAFLQVTLLSSLGSFNGSRPFGIFQQVNVLASFLATGFICLLVTGIPLQTQRLRIFRWGRAFALIFLPFMLVLLQSRAGWLGAGLGAFIWLGASNQKNTDIRRTIALILIGIFWALAWKFSVLTVLAHWVFPDSTIDSSFHMIPELPEFVNKAGSNWQRWKIYQITWNLIMQHPLAGSGYGDFEGAFTRQMLLEGSPIGITTLIHPHNELLYVWAEGGFVGLTGLLMMVTGIIVSLWQRDGLHWIRLALLLPIAVHMNVEFPLYQSVPHAMMLAILLAVVLPSGKKSGADSDVDSCHRRGGWLVRIFILTVSACLVIFMVSALQTQLRLTDLERHQLWPFALDEKGTVAELTNSFALPDRIDYDRHIALLMRYNLTRDTRLLEQFDAWAADFLGRHSDPNVSYSRLRIARVLMPSNVATLCHAGHRQWPTDQRFFCN